MKNTFLSEDFLLNTAPARTLYHNYAAQMHVIDYHSHLSARDIAENRQFSNLTEAWLEGDHYKWRAMRANGVNEEFITGEADDYLKFQHWAATVPYTIGNPLYHWVHLELKNYFGITTLLNPDTAEEIYLSCSAKLQSAGFSVRNLLKKMKVEIVCTTDDPTDTLEYHRQLQNEDFEVKVFPTFRPDKALNIEVKDGFNHWISKLEKCSGIQVSNFQSFIEALKKRHDFFHKHGCRLSDHGLETFYAEPYTNEEIEAVFARGRAGERLAEKQISQYRSAVLYELARMNHEKGWAQQFHIGAIRNNNGRLMRLLGADAGCDSIGDLNYARAMRDFFDRLNTARSLTKTIVYNLNPRDGEMVASMLANFNDGTMPGKMQYGAAWWFLDQKEGIEKHLGIVSNYGLLSRFVGMVTDSRSFLSFPRHEYFRRILCNSLGVAIQNGEIPEDYSLVGKMVQDICYSNALNYFNFELKTAKADS